MEKKLIIPIIIGIVLVFSILTVSALSPDTYDKLDFFSKIKYSLFSGNLFTAWGQENQCSVNADKVLTVVPNQRVTCSDYCSGSPFNYNKCAIDIFTPNYGRFIHENKGLGAGYTNGQTENRLVEIYCCPEDVSPIEEHSTRTYKCENGAWKSKGSFDKEEVCSYAGSQNNNQCWCASEDDNFYIDKNGAVHCRPSSYSSVNNGVWCPEIVEPECSSGQEQCDGFDYRICSNEKWGSWQANSPECGYTEEVPVGDLSAIISDIKFGTSLTTVTKNVIQDNIVESGERVIVQFQVKNNGDTGDYLIETGIIPKSVAEDWGFKYEGMELFASLDWLTQKNTECCEGQPNIFAKTTKLKSGEIDTFSIQIPKAPYSEIKDLCYDNEYWDGEGEYVLYIIVKTGCYPEGETVTYETKIITIGGDDDDDDIPKNEEVITMTWTEFYSTSNEDISFFGVSDNSPLCSEDSDCPLLEDYDVECDKSNSIKKRIWEGRKEFCKDKTSAGGIVGLAQRISNLIIGTSFCDISISVWKNIDSVFSKEPGMCIASSTTWYRSLWEETLKTVGGFGLPYQYVMIITIMLLITIVGLIIRMVT